MRASNTASSERLPCILNTRPTLNFLGVDRLDILPSVLGPALYVPQAVRRELREHVAWTSRDLEQRIRRHPESVMADEVGFVENLERLDARLLSAGIRRLTHMGLHELDAAQRLRQTGRLDSGESE